MIDAADDTERAALLRMAQQRAKRRLVLAAGIVAGCIAVGIAAGAFASGRGAGTDVPVGSTLLIAAGVGLVVAGVLAVAWVAQKRIKKAPLMMGADRATQRAVRAALKRGHTDDPHVDVLVRDLIERSRTPRWLPYAYSLFAVFFVVLFFLGDRDTRDVIRTVVLVAATLLTSGAFWLHLRRLGNYRGTRPE